MNVASSRGGSEFKGGARLYAKITQTKSPSSEMTMRTMTRIVLALVLLVGFGRSAQAQCYSKSYYYPSYSKSYYPSYYSNPSYYYPSYCAPTKVIEEVPTFVLPPYLAPQAAYLPTQAAITQAALTQALTTQALTQSQQLAVQAALVQAGLGAAPSLAPGMAPSVPQATGLTADDIAVLKQFIQQLKEKRPN